MFRWVLPFDYVVFGGGDDMEEAENQDILLDLNIPPQLVIVRWVEPYSQGDRQWIDIQSDLDDYDDSAESVCLTVGWLLKVTENRIVVAPTVLEASEIPDEDDDPDVGYPTVGVMTFNRRVVLSVTRIPDSADSPVARRIASRFRLEGGS